MKIDKDEAFKELLKIFLAFDGHPVQHQDDQWLNIKTYAVKLWESGWTRKEIYDLAYLMAVEKSLPDECSEAAGEYLDALLGRVSPNYILRFPGEPSDVDELVAYVRGMDWFR